MTSEGIKPLEMREIETVSGGVPTEIIGHLAVEAGKAAYDAGYQLGQWIYNQTH